MPNTGVGPWLTQWAVIGGDSSGWVPGTPPTWDARAGAGSWLLPGSAPAGERTGGQNGGHTCTHSLHLSLSSFPFQIYLAVLVLQVASSVFSNLLNNKLRISFLIGQGIEK